MGLLEMYKIHKYNTGKVVFAVHKFIITCKYRYIYRNRLLKFKKLIKMDKFLIKKIIKK